MGPLDPKFPARSPNFSNSQGPYPRGTSTNKKNTDSPAHSVVLHPIQGVNARGDQTGGRHLQAAQQ